ncbi:hypothetical protein BN1183_CB_00020 [Pantoea ananatis]|nr:hypothetical protein BN1183_CB_00020 [Pantoea ananatis]
MPDDRECVDQARSTRALKALSTQNAVSVGQVIDSRLILGVFSPVCARVQ